MPKSKKKSDLILIAIICIVILNAIASAYHLSHNIEKKTPVKRDVWLLSKGAFFLDTIKGNYEHLISDFPLVELTGQYEDRILIQGYENGRKYLNTEIRNDTLYVTNALPTSDTIPVAVDGDYPILVTIGAGKLKSITLMNKGRLDIPVNPYGSNPGGNIVYKPKDWEKYVLNLNKLDLTLKHGTTAEFFLNIDTLNIHIHNQTPPSNNSNSFGFFNNSLSIKGYAKKLNIINPEGFVAIDASDFKTDTLIVQSNPNKGSNDHGYIRATCNNYLKANLLYSMDIIYLGNPVIDKYEKYFGRVINGGIR